MWPQSTSIERERRIAEIAHHQWTMISLPQLTGLGHDVVPWQGYVMAAVLACGEGAVASHHSAARLHGLLSGARGLHVTVPGRRVRVRGVEVHQTPRLEPWQGTVEQRVPCTSWPRAIVDVAGSDGRRAAERMIERAEQLRIFDLSAIRRETGQRPRRRGARIVTSLLGRPSSGLTRNELEERLFAICEAAGFPRPQANYVIVLENEPDRVAEELGLSLAVAG